LSIGQEVVVDHPEATTLALASTPISPSELAKATGPWDDIAGFGHAREERLERPVFIVLHVFRDERGEHGGLDELHSHKYTQIA